MRHPVTVFTCAVAVLALTVSLAMAQTAPPSPSGAPSTPSDPGLKPAPPLEGSRLPQAKFIDGPVKDVDPVARTVDVGWMLGLLSTTLEVTDETNISIEGAKGSLDMIREGDRVKASYEARDGKNVAKSMEVTEGKSEEAMPSRAPGGTTSESPARSSAPSSGAAPKTP